MMPAHLKRALSAPCSSIPGPAAPNRGGNRGFTLIEIMIVVSIMAIVLAAGIPSIVRAMKRDSLHQAVNDVVEGCSRARAEAILKGVPAELTIRAEDGMILVKKVQSSAGPEPGGKKPSAMEEGPQESGPVFQARLEQDVAVELIFVNLHDGMNDPEVNVHFFPNGTSDEFTMVLRTESGSFKISLDLVTGLAAAQNLQ